MASPTLEFILHIYLHSNPSVEVNLYNVTIYHIFGNETEEPVECHSRKQRQSLDYYPSVHNLDSEGQDIFIEAKGIEILDMGEVT